MTGPAFTRLRESAGAFVQVFANPNLRRLELAWAAANLTGWAYTIALSVFAYEAGGAVAVGFVWLLVTVPPGVAAPFVAVLADRYPREHVMLVSTLIRVGALGGAALAAAADQALPVYVLAVVAALAARAFFPAQAAILPSLARSPDELTAANVVSSTIESTGMFLGPALGAALLAFTNTSAVFGASALALLAAVLLIARLQGAAQAAFNGPADRGGRLKVLAAGFRTIYADSKVRVLVALYAAQTLVAGALDVLLVLLALEALETGDSGVGLLNAAVGVGGLIGAVGAVSLVGGRLATGFAVGMALWGLPLVAIAVLLDPLLAFAWLLVLGIGNTLVDVSGLTLLQRVVPDEVLGRVFGVVEGLTTATIGFGAILAPVLVAAFGVRGALVAVGLLLPVLALLAWPALRRFNVLPARPDVVELLSAVPMLAVLPRNTLEQLAVSARETTHDPGEVIVRQGEPGQAFYVVADGELGVDVSGRAQPSLQRGDHFGEIALLRDTPRTATVSARTSTSLYALERDQFLAAVTGWAPSAEAADAAVARRLAASRPVLASL